MLPYFLEHSARGTQRSEFRQTDCLSALFIQIRAGVPPNQDRITAITPEVNTNTKIW